MGSIRLRTPSLEAPKRKWGMNEAQKTHFSHFILFPWPGLNKNCKKSVLMRAFKTFADAYEMVNRVIMILRTSNFITALIRVKIAIPFTVPEMRLTLWGQKGSRGREMKKITNQSFIQHALCTPHCADAEQSHGFSCCGLTTHCKGNSAIPILQIGNTEAQKRFSCPTSPSQWWAQPGFKSTSG